MKLDLKVSIFFIALCISYAFCQPNIPAECRPCPMDCQYGVDIIRENNSECRCVCSPSPCDVIFTREKACINNSVFFIFKFFVEESLPWKLGLSSGS